MNYIVQSGDHWAIHYHHWRATDILSDLYWGEKEFLNYVSRCRIHDEILTEPWIEACVILELDKKRLFFFTIHEVPNTSLMEYYLNRLSEKWPGWQVGFLTNGMYDAEKLLSIDYIAQQELPEYTPHDKDFIVDDTPLEWTSALIIIKNENGIFITRTGNITIEAVLIHGEEIIPLLLKKSPCELITEQEWEDETIFIDMTDKAIVISESIFGIWEFSSSKWPEFRFKMGWIGYLGVLRHANIDTNDLKLPQKTIETQFDHMVTPRKEYDPSDLIDTLKKENNNMEVNPLMFNNLKPKHSSDNN